MIENDELTHIFDKVKSTNIVEFDQNTRCKEKIVDDHCVKYHERYIISLSTND